MSILKRQLELGNFLKSARLKKQLSLRDVESSVKVSNAYLSQLEGGKIKAPSPSILHKLCELYEISYTDVMTLAGHPLPDTQMADVPKGQMEFARRIGSVTKDEADSLIEYLEFLRSRKGG